MRPVSVETMEESSLNSRFSFSNWKRGVLSDYYQGLGVYKPLSYLLFSLAGVMRLQKHKRYNWRCGFGGGRDWNNDTCNWHLVRLSFGPFVMGSLSNSPYNRYLGIYWRFGVLTEQAPRYTKKIINAGFCSSTKILISKRPKIFLHHHYSSKYCSGARAATPRST